MRAPLLPLPLLLLLSPVSRAAPPENRILSLPGATLPPSPLYSGYVPVGTAPSRHFLFHLLATSASATPETDPLVLWTTGGPGCSSLFAFLTEHGALNVNPDGSNTLVANAYAWNARANVIYVEAPVCVGNSWAEDGNCTSGDDLAAADNHAFLAGFLALYPEYQGRRFYLSGESYSGHYTLQLANLLYTNPIPGLNFQGFLVGNPSLDSHFDGQNYWSFMNYHGLSSDETYAAAVVACNGTFTGPLSPQCAALLAQIRAELPYTNPYNILAPCNGPPSLDGSCFTTAGAAAASGSSSGLSARSQTVVPCMNVTPSVAYLNLPAVKQALHVSPNVTLAWDVCSSALVYTQYAASVVDIYLALKDNVDILVYSGDLDSCVPFLCTEQAVDSFGWTPDPAYNYTRWWITDDEGRPQIAGYIRKYVSATGRVAARATIRGAGHMAPGADIGKPQAALALFNAFLDGGAWPITPPGA
jgi:hypothetical protein